MNDFDREIMRKMKNEETGNSEQAEPLEEFRVSMKKLAEEETLAGHAHFDGLFNPEELNESDRELYQRLFGIGGKTNIAEVKSQIMDAGGNLNESQKQLRGYIANKLQERMD